MNPSTPTESSVGFNPPPRRLYGNVEEDREALDVESDDDSSFFGDTADHNNINNNNDDNDNTNKNTTNYVVCKSFYIENGNSKKTLYLLCVGLLTAEGKSLLDIDQTPWSTIKKREIKPNQAEFVKEVKRRHETEYSAEKKPHPKNWATDKCFSWLREHPILNSADIEFLKFEVDRLSQVVAQVASELQEMDAEQN